MRVNCRGAASVITFVVAMWPAFGAGQTTPADRPNAGEAKTVQGVVRDLYCPMQNLAANAHDFDVDCAVQCLKSGSPIVIHTSDDQFYFPISDTLPDADQRARLMPFAGKRVEVVGTVRVRNGVRTISIQNIREIGKARVK